ncbi:MAG: hypothetical protein K2X47_06920 [Bdellovibrionales bacterium]|nr:hypothetical protein [Bdellovibrionales bacterium]
MMGELVSPAQINGLREAREMGISIGHFGCSQEYDSAIVPFVTWAGLIGQFEQAIQSYPGSPNMPYWISEQLKLQKKFVDRYSQLFAGTKKTIQVIPQKWIVDFYRVLKRRE